MSYLKVNVDNQSKPFVEELLQKLGYKVVEEKHKPVAKKRASVVSPTLLFDKWKDIELNPVTFRKDLWARKK